MPVLLAAIAILLTTGVAALALGGRSRIASTIGVTGALAGCTIGSLPAMRVLLGDEVARVSLGWSPPYGLLVAGIDPLSAFFLTPLFGIGAAAAIYGHGYLAAAGARRSLGLPWFSYNLLVASMALVITVGSGLLFLVAWEVMTLAAYLLVSWEHGDPEVRRAGWIYLLASHAATALLIALFLLLGRRAGSLDFVAIRAGPVPAGATLVVLFLLALCGFGVKAGFVPLHVWLPEAHAAAPSHVSALMSGVLVKMGIYGMLRTLTFFGEPRPWWGPTFVVIGLTGGAIGISLATYQRDLKRVLAYSTVENVGVITLGIGIGFWGWTTARADIASLAFGGALLHVWNHAAMKGALFLCAGSVLHAAGTRDLDRLGGLMKRMRLTSTSMVLGATAITALPPMNGFVSEWLIYVALARTGIDPTSGIAPLLAVGILSLIGAMTALAFVRLVGIALLGDPRSEQARRAHESRSSMTVPIGILVAACAILGMVPALLVAPLGRVVAQLTGARVAALDAAMLWRIGACNAGVWAAIGVVWLVWAVVRRGKPVGADATWGCGYAAPTSRMQYTAGSFGELATQRLLPGPLSARSTLPVAGAFQPSESHFASDCSDPLTRGVYEPFFERWAHRFSRLRWMQQGALHAYLAYILVMVVIGLGWVSIRAWLRS